MHPPVRSLSRGLKVLQELNASGPSSAQELSRRTGINRTTVYRLLSTLVQDGFVMFDEERGLFSPTPHLRQLSGGVTVRDESSQAAVPAMFKLLGEVNWPSDFAVFDRGSVLIRESTHPFSLLSIHRDMIGRRRSLLRSALGRAILTAAEPNLRREMLEIAAAFEPEDAAMARDHRLVANLTLQTERDGYASSVGETERSISAIALPILDGRRVMGSLNLIFFSSSMTPEIAAGRYLGHLRFAVTSIGARLSGSSKSAAQQV
jgi:IclR family mhp operon transcriptional activator